MTTPENQTIKVPDRYRQLGASAGFNPNTADLLNMIVEAPAGCGKTQLLMSMPGLLVFDFDDACQNAVSGRAARVPIRTYADYEALKALVLDDAAKGSVAFPRLGFDTADTWLRLIDAHLVEPINARRSASSGNILGSILEFGERGAGYTKLGAAIVRELNDFLRAGYKFVLTNHLRTRKETVGDTVVTSRRCAMAPSIMEVLVGMADIKARLYRSMDTTKVMQNKQVPDGKGGTKIVRVPDGAKTSTEIHYWLGLMPTDASDTEDDTKRRIPAFAGVIEIPLTDGYTAFATAYNDAVKAAREIQ